MGVLARCRRASTVVVAVVMATGALTVTAGAQDGGVPERRTAAVSEPAPPEPAAATTTAEQAAAVTPVVTVTGSAPYVHGQKDDFSVQLTHPVTGEPLPRITVVLQQLVGSTWVAGPPAATGADGRSSHTALTTSSTRYRAVTTATPDYVSVVSAELVAPMTAGSSVITPTVPTGVVATRRSPLVVRWTDASTGRAIRGSLLLHWRQAGQSTWSGPGTFSTDHEGRGTAYLTFGSAGPWEVRVSHPGSAQWAATATAALAVPVAKATAALTLSAPRTVTSETRARFALTLRNSTIGVPLGGQPVTLQRLDGLVWRSVATLRTDASGGAAWTSGVLWKSDARYRATWAGTSAVAGRTSSEVRVSTTPSGPVVVRPSGAPEPRVPLPNRPQASGAGLNLVSQSIPTSVWNRMYGVSWTTGCTPRADLRYVTMNYWGFDGYRYRGEMVLHRSAVARVTQAFGQMYAARYPIRQMRLVDDFGRGPYKGADDYASMAADNTSAFNCRYVVGREPERRLSPHSSGRYVDINPWENPYLAKTGWFPNTYYTNRSRSHRALITTSSSAYRAMIGAGFSWGGWYRDYHHFDW